MSGPQLPTDAEAGNRQYGEPEAKRIVKILDQIAESMEMGHIIELKAILSKIIESSKLNSPEEFKGNVRKFVEMVIFKAGISVSLFKQAVRGFLMIQRQPHLGDLVSQSISNLLKEEFPTLSRLGINDDTMLVYVKALKDGQEKVRHIRLMVVGMYGVGKTCLIRKICDQSIKDVKPTVGIDVSVNACEVKANGTWIVKEESEKDDKEFDVRLHEIMREASQSGPHPESEHTANPSKPSTTTTATPPVVTPTATTSNVSSKPEDRLYEVKEALNSFTEDDQPGIDEFRFSLVKYQKESKPKQVEKKNIFERKTTVSMWDFAGQSVYYSTHHFFLSSRSIYLLVVDISRDLNDKVSENKKGDEECEREEGSLLQGCLPEGFTCADALRFWINSIYTYTKEDSLQGGSQYHPVIVLVGTHKDKLKGTEKQKQKHKDDYFREALEPFRDNPVRKLIHNEKFMISCTQVFDKLRKSIYDIAKTDQKVFWEEPVPAKWIPLERITEEEKAKGNNFMTFTELVDKNKKSEFPLEDEDQIKLFLKFQHFLGNLLFYDVPNLDQTVILRPQWIIDMFKLFVTHHSGIMATEVEYLWSEFRNKAILRPKLIEYIISQSKEELHFKEYETEVLDYMNHLDVMAKPVTYSKKEEKVQHEDFFIIPCLLKKITLKDTRPLERYFQPDQGDTTSVLCFVFENGFLPPAVFHRLLATCIRRWEIALRKKDYLLYNGMGVFKLDGRRTLTLWYAEYVIYMRIALFSNEELICTEDCIEVKQEIKEMLKVILLLDKQKKAKTDDAKLQHEQQLDLYQEYILCEKALKHSPDILFKDAEKTGLLKVEDIKKSKDVMCECGSGCDGGHHCVSQDVLKYWYKEFATDSEQHVQESLKALFEKVIIEKGNLEGIPDDRDLAEIACYIGDEYWELGNGLGLSDPTMEQIRDINKYNFRKRILDIFEEWRKSSEETPSFQVLKNEIDRAKRNYRRSARVGK